MIMTDECKAYLLHRYHGEVYGEALFGALAASATDDGRRDKWQVLATCHRPRTDRERPQG